MRTLLKSFLLIFMIFGIHNKAVADVTKIKVDGITYIIWNFSSGTYAEVCAPDEGDYTGHIEIPEKIEYEGEEYPVQSIGAYAFCYDKITSITMPNSIREIRINAFLSCNNLTEIKIPASVEEIGVAVFQGCTALKNVIFEDSEKPLKFGTQSNCKSDKSFENTISMDSLYIGRPIVSDDNMNPFIGMNNTLKALRLEGITNCPTWFSNFSSLEHVYLPNTLSIIGNMAFKGCRALKTIAIPQGVITIGKSAFSECSSLMNVNIPNSTTTIGENAFSGCEALPAVIIPQGVTTIGSKAFYNCSSLTSVRLPESVMSIDDNAFDSCSLLMELAVLSPNASFGRYTGAGGNLYAYENVLKKGFRTNCHEIAIENPYYAVICTEQTLTSVAFQLIDIHHEQTECELVKVEYNGTDISPDEDGIFVITGLTPNQTCNIFIEASVDGENKRLPYSVSSRAPSINGSTQKMTQTGLRIELTAYPYDEDFKVKALGVELNGRKYETTSLGRYDNNGGYFGTVNISGLKPCTSYSFQSYAIYENGLKYYGYSNKFTTKGISPTIENAIADATSFRCEGTYTEGTATFKNGKFTFNQKEYEGNSLLLTGLDPNTKYTVTYTATTEEGSEETCVPYSFTTDKAPDLNTEKPTGVSNTCAIVRATTNICEDETGAGFQWVKYDAPASLTPNEGFAAIYEGKLEGYVKNLQPTSYYNVRAFYKSASGKYYYGNWVTFDPSDFSYFEPTVHTYAVDAVTDKTARIKGYVLPGTDEILEQGFQYWPTHESNTKAKIVHVAPMFTPSENASTILGTGQVMTAELQDLNPETTYCVQTFVKTPGNMVYGEEQIFTTSSDSAGTVGTTLDSSALEEIEYYDINGRRLKQIQPGLNIIRYSDGSTCKVLVK